MLAPARRVHGVAPFPAAALIAGSACGLIAADRSSAADPTIAAGVVAPLAAAAAATALFAWRTGRPRWLAAAIAAAFFFGGMLLAADAWEAAWRSPLRLEFEAATSGTAREAERDEGGALMLVTGVLQADAAPRPSGVSLSIDATRACTLADGGAAGACREAPTSGGLRLTVVGELAHRAVPEWRAGRTVRMPARVRRPSRYLNPGIPDEERALARRGVALVGTVKSGALVEVLAHGGWPAETAAAARAFVRRAIGSTVARWDERSAAIVAAIVIGDRTGLDDDVERRLQEAGTYHVIAISGGNIAILAGLTLACFRLAGLLGRGAMLAAIAGLLAYAFVVDAGPSVTRATWMAVAYFGARALDLRGSPVNTLAVVAAVMVALRPLAVADPGFLLTFGATAAIVLAVPSVTAAVTRPTGAVSVAGVRPSAAPLAAAAALLAASISAELALMPVGAALFSRVTFAGLALNFAAIPLMAVAQIAGMAAVCAFPLFPALAAWLGWLAHLGAFGLVRTADLVELAPAVTWRVAPPGGLAIAAYYLALGMLWALWRSPRPGVVPGTGGLRRARMAAGAILAAAALWILAEPWTLLAGQPGRLRVVFLDVGQGDAALVTFPRGSTLLVDAGGLATASSSSSSSFDIGDRVVAPVLRHVGIRRLTALALTHGDADHVGGAGSIIREFEPRLTWEGIPVPSDSRLAALKAAVVNAGGVWTNVQQHDLMWIDGVQVIVRHPGIPDWERQQPRNDDSIVVEILWREMSVVLTGDIGRETERHIAPLFPQSRFRVVKVPHHGSLTSSSSEFLRRLQPRVAVVSAGRGNPFGHPVPAVLQRYREVGAEVYRTDRDGAVTVESDGRMVEVRTFSGQARTYRVE
jgi:competence protein ComEC